MGSKAHTGNQAQACHAPQANSVRRSTHPMLGSCRDELAGTRFERAVAYRKSRFFPYMDYIRKIRDSVKFLLMAEGPLRSFECDQSCDKFAGCCL